MPMTKPGWYEVMPNSDFTYKEKQYAHFNGAGSTGFANEQYWKARGGEPDPDPNHYLHPTFWHKATYVGQRLPFVKQEHLKVGWYEVTNSSSRSCAKQPRYAHWDGNMFTGHAHAEFWLTESPNYTYDAVKLDHYVSPTEWETVKYVSLLPKPNDRIWLALIDLPPVAGEAATPEVRKAAEGYKKSQQLRQEAKLILALSKSPQPAGVIAGRRRTVDRRRILLLL